MLTAAKRALNVTLVTALSLTFLVFAVANREMLHLSLFPLPYIIDMPAFLFALICFAFGLIIGWLVVGMKLARSQRMLKKEHKRAMKLQSVIPVSRGDLEPKSLTEPMSLDPRARRG